MPLPKCSRILIALTCVFALALSAIAQAPSASVVGTITDPDRAAVPKVTITVTDVATGTTRTTTTSNLGAYEITGLKPATYDVTAEAPGFSKAIQRGVSIAIGDVVRIDLSLRVGSSGEVVEVKGEAPLVEPDKASVSYAIDTGSIQGLPLLARNFLNLALTVPGSIPQAPGTQAGGFSVSGMRAQSNNFTLDGIDNNDPQVNGPLSSFNMTDAIQEFNVQTSIAGAEVGRNPGAQVTVTTKSGTNSYHGTLFYQGRNEALDANDYFLNKAGQKKNVLRRHQFGGTMGGYIIPNKTFWFGSVEAVRLKNPIPVSARVPTAAEIATVTDPVSARLLRLFVPAANTPLSGGINWAGVIPQTDNNETYLLRVDHSFSSNNRFYARGAVNVGRTNTLQQTTAPFNGNITNWPSSHNYILADTFNTNRLVNEVRLGFSRNHTYFQAADKAINPAAIFTDAGGNPLPGFVDATKDALDAGLPRITVTGFSNFGLGAGTNMPQGRATNAYELDDDVTWSRGSHTLKFGGTIKRELTNRFLNGNFRGQIPFRSFALFGQGIPRTGSLRTGGPDQTFRNWFKTEYYMYAQDTWKVRSNLTMTYGLRYELPGAFEEIKNRGSNFVPGVGIVVLGSNQLLTIDPTALGRNAFVLTPTSVNLPSSGQFGTAKKNFAPYFGVTYAPGNAKTVIRTGFRLSQDEIFNNIPVNMGLNSPQVLSTTLPNGAYTWGTVLNQNRRLFNADPTVPGGQRGIVTFNAWETHPTSAYAMNYALEVERQFGSSSVLNVSYIGSQGRKLGIFVDPNQPSVNIINPARTGDSAPNQRVFPFPQYAGIGEGTFRGSSNFNSIVVAYKQRPWYGLTLNASYTYGKSLDYNSSFFGSDRDVGAPADTRNIAAEYGRSDFDIRHRVVLSYIYDLPIGHGHQLLGDAPGFVNQILGNWQISGITSLRSGFPFTVWADLFGTDFSGLNQFADRVNFAPGVSNVATNMGDPTHAFDPTAFVNPAGGSIGALGRNTLTGPRATNFDFSVTKNFSVMESRRFQFRAEFFNLFNHTQFNLPSSTLSSSAFGTITSDSRANPRLVQLGLRFEY